MSDKNFYITTPIYYVNGEPHMGHVYTSVACDIIKRFKQLDGYNARLLTGTDEHGIKVMQSARDAGIEPQAFTDKVAKAFQDAIPMLNVSADDFIRTTEPRHKQGTQAAWKKLQDAGLIYKDSYSGWYAVRDEAYYNEDETEERPDGKRYALASGAECTWMEEESYFFKLSSFTDRLLKFYEENPDFIQPAARRNEIVNFVKQGLRDLSISRTTFDWGIPVPGDEKHVMYVWLDALFNYITALGYPDTQNPLYAQYWNENTDTVHIVGKEIIRFHCVYWPAFLWGAGVPLPKTVYANGWWTVEGQKMSKSLGNVIAPSELVERFGVDGSRYALFCDVPFGNDGDFNFENAFNRVNADLANGLGNLAQRTLSMIAKNCEGKLPTPGAFTADDEALLKQAHETMLTQAREHLNHFRIHKMLESIWDVVDAANQYVDIQAPWKLRKEDPARMETVLYVLAETLRCLGIMVQPIVPESAAKLLEQLSVPQNARSFDALSTPLQAGTSFPEPQGVFPRLEAKEAA